MHWLLTKLASEPFIALFLVAGAGYALGRVQIHRIGLGSVASTLIIGIGLSILAAAYGVAFEIPPLASTIFFNLFMFSVGVKVGPQFLVGIRRDAKNFILIGLFIPLASIGLMLLFRQMFHLEPGMTAGIFAGANTATPGLGAAQAAISSGGAKIPPGVAQADVMANLATAFAFNYCASVVLFAVMIKVPDLLGRDSVKAAKDYEATLRGASDAALPGAPDEFFGRASPRKRVVRAYRIEQPRLVGATLGELRSHPRASVERVVRDGEPLEMADDLALAHGDVIALFGDVGTLVEIAAWIGPEVTEAAITDIGAQTVDVVVSRKETVGKSLGELARGLGYGLFLNAMFRAGDEIPFGEETKLQKGDVLRVTGSKQRIAVLEHRLGALVRPSINTDLVTLALGLALGGILGGLTLHAGGIVLQLGSAVGLLVVGMALSILRTRNPHFGGPYPEPARQLVEDLGLVVFVAVLGLNAGTGVVHAIGQGAMVPIVVGCLIVGFIPPILAWLLGHYVLEMNDALLIGAVAGGRCSSPGMRAAQETTHSTVPTISYPATFAISNIVFTLLTYLVALRSP